MKINNGILCEIEECDLINGEFRVPKEVKEIGEFASSKLKKCKNFKALSFENGSELEKIDGKSFCEIASLQSVDLSNCTKLTEIRSGAFGDCLNLSEVNFSSCRDLLKIGAHSFLNCKSLEHIDLCDCEKLKKIEASAFENCTNVKDVNLSACKELSALGEYAFRSCKNLKEVDLNNCERLNDIGVACFELCENLGVVKIDALKELEVIGAYSFGHTGLKEFVAPSSKELELTFGEFVFAGCDKLKRVNFENCNVSTLGWGLFSNCNSLKDVSFNGGKVRIVRNIFRECNNIENVDFRDVSGVEQFDLRFAKVKNVKLNNNVKWDAFQQFKQVFDGGTKISLYNGKGEVGEQFVMGVGSNYENIRIGALHLDKKCRDKKLNIPYKVLNVLFSEKEIGVFLDKKGIERFNKMVDAMSDYRCGSPFVAYLRALGYFGLEDYKTGVVDKAKVDEYKKLLARDLVYNKIKKDIKGETNKDYINKIINEKVLKVARSYSLSDLVYSFVMNNVAGNGHLGDLLEALTFVGWRRDKNVEFAQFMVLHFDEIMEQTVAGKDWKNFKKNRDFDNIADAGTMSFLGIFENFDKVLENSNKKVITRSDKNRLTLADFEAESLYAGVTEENKELATYCLKAHIKQDGFDFLKGLFEKGKAVKDKQVLKVCEDEVASGKDLKNNDNADLITYKVIEKGDPLGLVLGNITNCCQKFGGAGEDCMIIGATCVDSGFVTINEGDKILAQGWIWYDAETSTVAIDNIEVPEVMSKIVNKERKEEVADCLQRFCDNVFKTMNKNGYKVLNVVIGASYSDVDCLRENYVLEKDSKKMFDCPFYMTNVDEEEKVYSDITKNGQYVVYKDGRRIFNEPEIVDEYSAFYGEL